MNRKIILNACASSLIPMFLLVGCSAPVDRMLPEPEQSKLEQTTGFDGRRLKRLALFHGEVIVLSRRDYARELERDPLSEFAPVDLAVGWGLVGHEKVRSVVSVHQVNRRYAWRAGPDAWQRPEIRRFGEFSANWHLIPANNEVAARLSEINEGDVVRLEGELVAVRLANGTTARSSLTRTDFGDGACEIVLVRSLVVSD